MLLYSVQGKHPVDLFPQQQQYLHASIHSTVVVTLLVVVALYVKQRYIAYFVVYLEPRYSAYFVVYVEQRYTAYFVVFVERRFIAYFVVYVEPKYSAYLCLC